MFGKHYIIVVYLQIDLTETGFFYFCLKILESEKVQVHSLQNTAYRAEFDSQKNKF